MSILWFTDYTPDDKARVGGKNASLGEMTADGLPVPPGFAVTTEAFTGHVGEGAAADIRAALAGVDASDHAALEAACSKARHVVLDVALDGEVEAEVREAYATLCERIGEPDVPVAVRSSATAEDLPDASFAGQQDTYLWIRGADAVVEHVKKCWASLFTERAVAYRIEKGFDHSVAMSVGVQQMVVPRASGVAFTLNPANGDRSQVAIDASWGFGEAIVSGEVTPDHFLVDKVMFEIVGRTISNKHIELRLDASGVGIERVHTDEERANKPCLSDDELKAIARLAKDLERKRGTPQDMEWAVDDTGTVALLQCRPETVWSKKPRESVTKGKFDLMGGLVSSLLEPLAKQQKKDDAGD
ncbi:MAG: PEP/pyruvate-binding domain-containing protein [Deltaproteobacteria bacterium]